MFSIKAEPTSLERNQINAKCSFCQARIRTENELQERLDDRESEILNLKNQIQNLKLKLSDKEMKL